MAEPSRIITALQSIVNQIIDLMIY